MRQFLFLDFGSRNFTAYCYGEEKVMIKTEKKEIKTFHRLHHYYCDKCGKEIAVAEEYEDDVYVPTPDNVYSSGIQWNCKFMFYPATWYSLEGDYCIDCRGKIEDEVMEFFKKMGITTDFKF